MLAGAILLVVLAAIAGVTMLAIILKQQPIPAALPVAHGVLAAPGVLLAFLVAFRQSAYPLLCVALGAFILAGLGGLFLLSFHIRKKPFPMPVVYLHGAVAAVGVIVLIVYAAQ